MTLTVRFTPAELAELRKRARALGKPVGTLVRELAVERQERLL